MTVADHLYPHCCVHCKEDMGRHLCRSCDGSCDLDQGLLGTCGLCRGSSSPAPSQVLLSGQQQELRLLFPPGEQLYITVLLGGSILLLLYSSGETPVGATAAGAASSFSSAGSWSGSISESKKGRFKKQKKWVLFPQASGASVRAAMPNPASGNCSRASGLGRV